MTRKSPIRHKVCSHKRKNKPVQSFMRGKGKHKVTGQRRRFVKHSNELVFSKNENPMITLKKNVPESQIKHYKIWFGDTNRVEKGSYQIMPARNRKEALRIQKAYWKFMKWGEPPRVKKVEFDKLDTIFRKSAIKAKGNRKIWEEEVKRHGAVLVNGRFKLVKQGG